MWAWRICLGAMVAGWVCVYAYPLMANLMLSTEIPLLASDSTGPSDWSFEVGTSLIGF